MASSALQVFGFTLGVLAWVGMIGTCASPEWRKNSHGQTLIDNTLKYEGLWVSCTAFVTGQTNCKDYAEFFVNLPQVLQICRALMISSIGTGFVAIIITVLGMKCVGLGSSNHIVKARIALLGGLLFGISGFGTAAASYCAYLWSTKDGYTVMSGFYVVVATACAGMLSSLLVIMGSCCASLPVDEIGHSVPARTFSFRKRKNEEKVSRYFGCQQTVAKNFGSRNPVYVADFV
uniref:claudin-7-like isoform X2 n=1 Tax=Ciona intestinalis TaxID=7719 RepID=UPI00089DBBEA|nr:claudin-7-like isoform X2 [Ciona intestinalis]|eukprot:XP_018672567.1 claudin-7-like isoform X2 [Ciona intestinalis]